MIIILWSHIPGSWRRRKEKMNEFENGSRYNEGKKKEGMSPKSFPKEGKTRISQKTLAGQRGS